jgi:hypothetical protein
VAQNVIYIANRIHPILFLFENIIRAIGKITIGKAVTKAKRG